MLLGIAAGTSVHCRQQPEQIQVQRLGLALGYDAVDVEDDQPDRWMVCQVRSLAWKTPVAGLRQVPDGAERKDRVLLMRTPVELGPPISGIVASARSPDNLYREVD